MVFVSQLRTMSLQIKGYVFHDNIWFEHDFWQSVVLILVAIYYYTKASQFNECFRSTSTNTIPLMLMISYLEYHYVFIHDEPRMIVSLNCAQWATYFNYHIIKNQKPLKDIYSYYTFMLLLTQWLTEMMWLPSFPVECT